MAWPYVPKELREIADRVSRGERPAVSVRTLLAWFWGHQRRGAFVNRTIRAALAELGLETVPDFDATYLDGQVTFLRSIPVESLARPSPPPTSSAEYETSHGADVLISETEQRTDDVDATYRIARLRGASNRPVTVTPETTINEAVTIMLENDFSQLPVIIGERAVKGMFSWKSLAGRLSQGHRPLCVKECMDPCRQIGVATPLLAAIEDIVRHECVLVRDTTHKVCGILTTSDLSEEFHQLAEPYMLLEEIEKHLRDLLGDKFTKDELAALRDPVESGREIASKYDLTIGEYQRLFENRAFWDRIGLQVDRAMFVDRLNRVREIRNDVMHFDPDPLGADKIEHLRRFAELLRRIQQIRLRGDEGRVQ